MNKKNIAVYFFFTILSLWWFFIYSRGLKEGIENNAFTLIYPFVSLFGGIVGFFVSKNWGGVKSDIGKAISLLSLGLLAQFFGQASFAYFIYIKGIEVPYPSVADIGFLGSAIFYIIGASFLLKSSGIKFSLKSLKGKIITLIIPLVIITFSYFFFLKGYEFDWSSPLKIFLDFGYPLCDATYLFIILLTFLLCKNFLGGNIRKLVLFLSIALTFQYIADSTFLYQASNGTWYVGGINDYLYFSSYFLMTLALIYSGKVFQEIKSNNSVFPSTNDGILISNTVKILNQIILAIIRRQERIAGQIAWEEAKEVPGLKVLDQQKGELSVDGNTVQGSMEVVDNLVLRYKHIFGDLAVQVSKDAARHFIAELSKEEVPKSLL